MIKHKSEIIFIKINMRIMTKEEQNEKHSRWICF